MNPITRHCRLCASLVSGCQTCLASGDCLACQPGCTLVNSSYCECRPLCPYADQYYYPHLQGCECEFQHYRAQDNSCLRCQQGCYSCYGVLNNCSACIDNY